MAQRRKFEQNQYKADFWSFTVDLLGYQDIEEEPHREVFDYLLSPGNFKLVLLPRGSFKSTIFTVSYPIWRLAQDPNLRILIDSKKTDRSEVFLAGIKDHIEKNVDFRDVFGEWKYIPGWERNQIRIALRTKALNEPSIMTSGINAPVTGGHYDLIIADDLHDETNSQTEEQCKKVILHYQTLFPILEPHGMMTVIGTRWSNWDLYGHILGNEKNIRL